MYSLAKKLDGWLLYKLLVYITSLFSLNALLRTDFHIVYHTVRAICIGRVSSLGLC